MKKITLLAMSLMMALVVKAQDAGIDITSTFTNTDFETQNVEGWTISGPANADSRGAHAQGSAAENNYQGTWFMEAWNTSGTNFSEFDWSQTVEVPNGYYAVKALAHAIQQKDGSAPTGVYIYAEDVKTPVTTTTAAEYSVFVSVTDGTLTIGYCGESTNVNWAGCDYFRVMQYIADTEDAAKTMWAKDEMYPLSEELSALTDNYMSAALKEEIKASIAAIETVADFAAADALWTKMKQQKADATACVAAYEKLILKIDEVYAEADKGADNGYDTDELYDAAGAAKESAQALENEYKEKLAQAQQTSDRMVKEAVARGQNRQDEIISQANAEARAILDKAAAGIAQEKKKALNDAKNEISEMAMAIAEKVVGRELNDVDQAKLVDEFIEELGD